MTPEEREPLIARYADGHAEVARALEGMSEADRSAHPLPGKWSAREIVQHLADSESISAQRLRRLLAEAHPVIQGYDQAAWAVRLRYNERDLAPALDAFRAARATTLQVMENMGPEDWGRTGWHTESGAYSAETWLRVYADHAHNHAAQIRRLRAALGR
jgi:hypothetical protein